MRTFLLLASLSTAMCVLTPASTATWHVDCLATSSRDGKTLDTAFQEIQEKIDAASDGDAVIVAPGNCVESIHLKGKDIVLRSTQLAIPGGVLASRTRFRFTG